MSSYETETARLVAAIPAENESLCPGCSLNTPWIDKAERVALLEEVACRQDVAEKLHDRRMSLHHLINPTEELQAGIAAECLLTRALGACLVHIPRGNNE